MSAPTTTALPVLGLTEALPGFPGHHSYVLVAADTDGLIYWLQSVTDGGPRFLAVPPGPYFPDYAPTLPDSACADLQLTEAAEALLLCLVTVPGEDVGAATANLRAPVVINQTNRRAAQVVLSDSDHPIRRRLRR